MNDDNHYLFIKLLFKKFKRKFLQNDIRFINNEIVKNPLHYENISELNIGYRITNSIDFLQFESNKLEKITSITLPAYGIWIIEYRLNLNLETGMLLMKTNEIRIKTGGELLLDDINKLTPNKEREKTINGVFVYVPKENKLKLDLFVSFIFGRKNTPCILTMYKNKNVENDFNLRATRIG